MDAATTVLREWARRQDRAVIFDFNGTLSDDEPVLLRVFAELFAEHFGWHLTEREYVTRLAGLSDREIVQRVASEQSPGHGPDVVELLLRRRRRRYRRYVREESPVRPPTRALVRRLAGAGVPMALVTGAQRADVELVLRRSGLDGCFTAVVTEEDVTRGKPHPEGFLTGARLLGVAPAAVLVLEDSVAGVLAARAAGMRAVGVPGGGAVVDDLVATAEAVVPALGPELFDGLLGRTGSAGLDAGVHGDARAVGAEEVEGVLDG